MARRRRIDIALACLGLADYPLTPVEAERIANWAVMSGRAPRMAR
jgi:hypothetical protein